MSDDPKRKSHLSDKGRRSNAKPTVFDALGCRRVSYDFTFSRDSFGLDAFYKVGRISKSERLSWTGSCAPKDQASGYHIHFKGRVKDEKIEIEVEFFRGSIARRPDEKEPFAETFMNWLGTFVRNSTSHAVVYGRFEKSNERWRSRFNLPFKVTLSGLETEVTIDGISLILPSNKLGAKHGWLTKRDQHLTVDVLLERRVNLKQFQLDEEITTVNNSIRMFVEEIGK